MLRKIISTLHTPMKLTFSEHKQHLPFGFTQTLARFQEFEWYKDASLRTMGLIYSPYVLHEM